MANVGPPRGPVDRLRALALRTLRIYLVVTTALYATGVALTLFPPRPNLTLSDPLGGQIAVALGIVALIWLRRYPARIVFAEIAAVVATPVVMAFHRLVIAEYLCTTAALFLAIYLRVVHRTLVGRAAVVALAGACVTGFVISPSEPYVISYLIVGTAIIAAAEGFGVFVRAVARAACVDQLTGLLNRAGWELATAQALDRRRRTGDRIVTVVTLDVDGLKQINDTLGHAAGDRCIVGVAAACRSLAPRGTVIARIGGDEFALCFTHREDTVRFFLAALARHPDVRASIGSATTAADVSDVTDLLAAADAVLIERKRARRTPPDLPERAD